eukprot:5843751-Karenia_brevis.AAC.1
MNQAGASTFSIAFIDPGSTQTKPHMMRWGASMTLIGTVATTTVNITIGTDNHEERVDATMAKSLSDTKVSTHEAMH